MVMGLVLMEFSDVNHSIWSFFEKHRGIWPFSVTLLMPEL